MSTHNLKNVNLSIVSSQMKMNETIDGKYKPFFTGGNQRRVLDIARLEVIVTSLLDQLRPTLDATARRAERRLTQTSNEKEREMVEEINGAFNSNEDGSGAGDLVSLRQG